MVSRNRGPLQKYTQRVQRLPRRRALIQLPEREREQMVRTPTVPERQVSDKALEDLKCYLAKQSGRATEEVEAAIARRGKETALEKELPIRYYEDIAA